MWSLMKRGLSGQVVCEMFLSASLFNSTKKLGECEMFLSASLFNNIDKPGECETLEAGCM